MSEYIEKNHEIYTKQLEELLTKVAELVFKEDCALEVEFHKIDENTVVINLYKANKVSDIQEDLEAVNRKIKGMLERFVPQMEELLYKLAKLVFKDDCTLEAEFHEIDEDRIVINLTKLTK